MKQLSVYEEEDRKAIVYSKGDNNFVVVFYESNECCYEKEYFRDWEAEEAAEDFVVGFDI